MHAITLALTLVIGQVDGVYDPHKLIELKATAPGKTAWFAADPRVDMRFFDNNRTCVLTAPPGEYVVFEATFGDTVFQKSHRVGIRAIPLPPGPGPAPPTPTPGPGPGPTPTPPAPLTGVAKTTSDLCKTLSPAAKSKIPGLAEGFRALAAAIAAGTLDPRSRECGRQTQAMVQAKSGDQYQTWVKVVFTPLMSDLAKLNLTTASQLADAYEQIATGMEAAK